MAASQHVGRTLVYHWPFHRQRHGCLPSMRRTVDLIGGLAGLAINKETRRLEVEGRPQALGPDLILLLELSIVRGLIGVCTWISMEVSLPGVPCYPGWFHAAQSRGAAKAFSPYHCGRSDLHYMPIRALLETPEEESESATADVS